MPRGFDGEIADLYDVFVDWPARLGRELPGVVSRVRAAEARRVLDVGCGTGRHAVALAEEGFEVVGCDPSEPMLARARDAAGERAHFVSWAVEEDVPASIGEQAPFDAVLALGNVWPQLVDEGASDAALANLRGVMRPGAVFLAGLKAFGVRREGGNPYLPLLRRTHEGRTLFFVRFVDFDADPTGRTADFHFCVLAGDHERESMIDHRIGRVRVWTPDELARAVAAAGFQEVSVSGSIADPAAPVGGEDVFVHARA